MRRSVKIGVNVPHPLYIPQDVAKDGFVGKTDIYINAGAIVVRHPDATLEELVESLNNVLGEIDFAIKVQEVREERLNYFGDVYP